MDVYFGSTKELNDVFDELCYCALFVGKCLGNELMKIGSMKLKGLKSILVESATSLQASLDANSYFSNKKK